MLGNEYLTIKETLDFLNKNTQSQINFEYLSNLVLRKKLKALIQVDTNFTLVNNPREKTSKYRIIAYCSFDGKYIKDFNISAVGSYVQNEPIYRLADIPYEFIIYEFFSSNLNIELKQGSKIYTPIGYFPKDIKTGRICITKAIYESYAVTKTNVRFHIDELKKLIGMIEESHNPQAELQQAKKEIEQLKAQKENNQALPTKEGQGDSLLTLGAVLSCLPKVAKPNYTQALLIQEILEQYPHIKNLSESTLKKKFSESKNHLNQSFN